MPKYTNIFQIFTKSDIIENRDVLMTIIVMLKFTQLPRPTLYVCLFVCVHVHVCIYVVSTVST